MLVEISIYLFGDFIQLFVSQFSVAFAASCSRKYTVKVGDFCDKISQEQHVSTCVLGPLYDGFFTHCFDFSFFLGCAIASYQLAVNNPSLVDRGCTNLQVGESLCLGTTNEDCSTTHTVQTGDTCDKIATANGLNMTILHMNNPQLDQACDIYEGEVRVFFVVFPQPIAVNCGISGAGHKVLSRPNNFLRQVLCTSKTVQVPPIPSGGVPKSTPGSKFTPPPPSPTRTSSSHSFPGVTIISFPSSSASTVPSGHQVVEHAPNKPSTEHASPPEPTESDLIFCDEL